MRDALEKTMVLCYLVPSLSTTLINFLTCLMAEMIGGHQIHKVL